PIVVGIMWVTNLYNFMDGSDGLAGGMTVAGFAFLGTGAWMSGDEALLIECAIVAAAGAAFLLFNFPPARLFMGDAGSVPIGFLAAVLSLSGWRDGDWPFWFPAAVFAPFIADATLTLFKRILARERFWEAHHKHYYQRLVRMGWSHRGTAVTAAVPLHALIFWLLGLYQGSWRYASLPDLKRIAFACLIGALAVPALLAFFRAGSGVPRSTFILAPLLLAAIMSGSRIGYRAWKERVLYGHVHLSAEPVLVIGAGDITVNLLREIERSSQWRAVGILDDDPAWHGQVLLGVRVFV